VPLFILWFGIGNVTMIVVVTYAATFPMIYNVWTGVRSVSPIWLRAAARWAPARRTLFWKSSSPERCRTSSPACGCRSDARGSR
jgi:ABC-type nitrate/sulfonate/bicarbonate transport system permease component